MPKHVDHDARRDELAQAVWELISHDGVGGVTIRRLAAQSGWSSGAIRHYLPTREAILNFAAERLASGTADAIRGMPRTGDPRADFRAALLLTMPFDEESRRWCRAWLAFTSAAVTDPTLAGVQAAAYGDLRAWIEQALTGLGVEAARAPAAAAELHGLVDGLVVHMLLGATPAGDATRAVDAALDRLLPPDV